MSFTLRLAALAALSVAAAFAETWTAPLVDSKCYGAELRNVNPTNTQPYANSDFAYEIRYCSPTHKTKYFAIVSQYGNRLQFDPAGNDKAAQLVKDVKKKHMMVVVVTGQLSGKVIKVESISPPREQ